MTEHPTRDGWVTLSRADLLDRALIQRNAAGAETPPLRHECEDGHAWTQQPDGGVSPSYGLGATSIKFPDWNAARCPEPDRYAIAGDYGPARGIKCDGCGELGLPFHMLPGLSCSPWDLYKHYQQTGHVHTPPLPACGKPPIRTHALTDHGWIEVRDGQTARAGDQLDLLATLA